MLFDTHSPRRRKAVQVIFAFLALLMGGGLVLFGIGTNQSGTGIFDNLNSQQTDAVKQAQKQAEQAQTALAANSKDEAAADKLAYARLTIAANKAWDAKTGNVAKDGQQYIDQADAAWTAYLKLGPAKPDAKTAFQFVNFYLTQGAVDYAKAARALQAVLVTRPPSAGLYAQLALYNLAAGNTSEYKQARAKAISLADSKERRTAIAKQLDEYEQKVNEAIKAQQKQQAEQSGSSSDGKGTTPLKSLPDLGGISSGGGLNTAGGSLGG